jgi:hypothetical protein
MKKTRNVIKAIGGYTWAFFCISLGVYVFMNFDSLKKELLIEPGVHVSDKWMGGDILYEIDYPSYILRIHEPVWDGFNQDSNRGFVQIDWIYKNGYLHLKNHGLKNQEISLKEGGETDFSVSFNTETGKIDFKPFHDGIVSVMDKTSLVNFIYEGYDDNRNGLFIYKEGVSMRVIIRRDLPEGLKLP